jgi:hypothetical protein
MKSIQIDLLHFYTSYNNIIVLHINSLQTSELHMQPLRHFIKSRDFIVKDPSFYVILAIVIFYNFNK